MKTRRGFTLIELLVVIAIIAVLAAILFPVFANARKAGINANCQSNMSQIGRAFKMYVSEWHDMYPTNRDTLGALSNHVMLTPGTVPPQPDGKPTRFNKGVNWVEALYPYMEAISPGTSSPSSGAWRCGASKDNTEPPGTTDNAKYAAVSYSFNAFLVEQPEGVVRTAANLMMCREMDRRVNSMLRPANVALQTVASTTQPRAPFLTTVDQDLSIAAPKPLPKQHGNGSNILFADGHVKGFSSRYFPTGAASSGLLDSTNSWDADESSWFNYNKDSTLAPVEVRRTIEITP